MDLQRFGFNNEQQARVDGVMLDLTLSDLGNNIGHKTTRDELEAVYLRSLSGVHEQTCAQLPTSLDGSLEPAPHPASDQVLTNLGKLSFIDAQGFPSSEQTKRKDVETVEYFGQRYRRLFSGLITEPEA